MDHHGYIGGMLLHMTPSSSKQLNSFTGSALIFKSKRSHILVGDKKFSCSVWNLFFFHCLASLDCRLASLATRLF